MPRAHWHKGAAIVVSVVFHATLLTIFLDSNRHQLPLIEQSGNAGSAFSVVMINLSPKQDEAAETEELMMQDSVIKTVVVKKAEIVVPKKTVHRTSTTVKKTITPPSVTKPAQAEKPIKRLRETISANNPASMEGMSVSQARKATESSGGNSVKAGESTVGLASKGAGTTTSSEYHILNRRVNYPTRARSMGVEGRVKVKYDVSASGTIKNIRILEEDPPDVFSGDLRRDMLRWRYDTTGELKDQVVTVIFKIDGRIQLMN